MRTQPLDQYVRIIRKRSGLAQRDVARLLGYPSSSQISMIESYQSLPRVPDAIALALILDEPIESLFQGIYEQVGKRVHSNAIALLQELQHADGNKTLRLQQRITRLQELTDNNLNQQTYGQEESMQT